jgi:hypothetical protein
MCHSNSLNDIPTSMLANNQGNPLFSKCSGCGKRIVSDKRIYKSYPDGLQLTFCSTCIHHIDLGGSIFFRTYSFEPDLLEPATNQL